MNMGINIDYNLDRDDYLDLGYGLEDYENDNEGDDYLNESTDMNTLIDSYEELENEENLGDC